MKREYMGYREALEYLFGLQKYGIKFGLNKTSNLLKAFGNPHRGQKYIHIAGTNGKGSVAAMMASILMRSGLKVGFYSSPHLVSFTERFQVNGQKMEREKAAAMAGELMDVIDPGHPPTFFEVTTAMALIYFAREETDISVIEVGMGGRLDATNVIRPLVSIITNISLEHQAILGPRLMDIAREKAGIIKRGVDLVTAPTQPAVWGLFQSLCVQKAAPFWRVGRDIHYRADGLALNYYGINHRYKGLQLGLRGKFQHRNAALALAGLEILGGKGFKISHEDIREGLKGAAWPGRMQVVSRDPLIILDGAHNPAAVRVLAESITRECRYRQLILVMGVMADKDIRGIVQGITPMAHYVIYTRPEYSRSASPENLMKAAARFHKRGEVTFSIPQALDKAREIADPRDLILVCGSLFTVGEALTYFFPELYSPDETGQG